MSAEKQQLFRNAYRKFYEDSLGYLDKRPKPGDAGASAPGYSRGAAMTIREGIARNTDEMRFAVSITPCPHCGARETGELELFGGGPVWSMTGPCPRCGQQLGLAFRTEGSPLGHKHDLLELNGSEPSQVISPEEFVEELERVLPNVLEPEQQQSPQLWRAAAAASHRVRTILNELLKFSGETIGGRTRANLEAERERQNALGARYAADAPRIWALEEVDTPKQPVYDGPRITRELLLGHQRWVRAGRTGPGRIDLERTNGAGLSIGAAELSGVRLRGCRLVGINRKYARLDSGEVQDCDFSRGMLDAMSLRDAHVSGCVFISAAMAIGKFEHARIEGCDFSRSDLERSQWEDAKVARTMFTEVRFGNAAFDNAQFVGCDMSGASFAPLDRLPKPTTSGARFEDCDLRDTDWAKRDLSRTSFIRCKLSGAHGEPSAMADLTVEDVTSALTHS